MRIRHINIKNWRKTKILHKHGVCEDEIRMLFERPHYGFRSRNGCYIAVGCPERYLTVIFKIKNNIADIITAYPSSGNQISLYRRKIR